MILLIEIFPYDAVHCGNQFPSRRRIVFKILLIDSFIAFHYAFFVDLLYRIKVIPVLSHYRKHMQIGIEGLFCHSFCSFRIFLEGIHQSHIPY